VPEHRGRLADESGYPRFAEAHLEGAENPDDHGAAERAEHTIITAFTAHLRWPRPA
jgi:hypothetical protein